MKIVYFAIIYSLLILVSTEDEMNTFHPDALSESPLSDWDIPTTTPRSRWSHFSIHLPTPRPYPRPSFIVSENNASSRAAFGRPDTFPETHLQPVLPRTTTQHHAVSSSLPDLRSQLHLHPPKTKHPIPISGRSGDDREEFTLSTEMPKYSTETSVEKSLHDFHVNDRPNTAVAIHRSYYFIIFAAISLLLFVGEALKSIHL